MHRSAGLIRLEALTMLALAAVVALIVIPHDAGAGLAHAEREALADMLLLSARMKQFHSASGHWPVAAELAQKDDRFQLTSSRDTLQSGATLFRIWVPAASGGATALAAARSREAGPRDCILFAWPARPQRTPGRIFAWVPDQLLVLENLTTPYAGVNDAPPPALLGAHLPSGAFGSPLRWATRLPWKSLSGS